MYCLHNLGQFSRNIGLFFKRVYFLLVRTFKMENVGGNGAVEMSELLVYISRKGVKAAGDL